jgi:hypothetical protein
LVALGAGFDWDYPYSCQEWAETFGLTYPLLDDSSQTLVNLFNVLHIPYHVILDHTMTVRYAAYGWNQTAVTDTIQLLLSELAALDIDHRPARSQPLPEIVTLAEAYPNPFNPSVTLAYTLREGSPVQMRVVDIRGRTVTILEHQPYQSPGSYEIVWNASSLGSGIYFVHLQAGNVAKTRKLVLMK